MDAKKVIVLLGLIFVLSGCSSTGGGLCSMGPFIPDIGAGERWTLNEKRKLIARNNAGVEVCGWERPA
ncbi:lipoprotein [Maritalea porphyrae]|uniref:lipoprotein n=1 Tax=Maritalea porphyrae TaxID=880732 RepID=UPI0022AFDF1D|nr:lipoprotein [Maritalea porphyrae]MCZ4273224.1 lipoprotein [Maritalea porphyrae]